MASKNSSLKIFAKRIRLLRELQSFTQHDLGKKINVATTTYSGYENAAREPNFEKLNNIADFFGVSVDYLLGRTDIFLPYYNAKCDMEDENVG
jgi:transcriptional regulator with XRE-family HTH domain